jgi:ABC-2 type transport system permease protein
MSIMEDALTLLAREMLIFKKNLGPSLARTIIFPVIFILLLGSIGNAPKHVPIAIVNYDTGATSLGFINLLTSGGSLSITSVTNQQDALNLLTQGDVAAVVVIPSGFSAGSSSEVYVYVDASSSASAAVASGTISEAAAGMNEKLVERYAQGRGISVVTNPAYGATSNNISFTVAGILVLVATTGAIFSGGFTVLQDRQLGNLKAFLVTPINKFSILLSKVFYGTFQSAFSAYVALAIGILYGASIASGLVGTLEILWVIFLVGFGFSCIAVSLAIRMKQTQTYALVAQVVSLPMSFLAGALVPVSSLPAFLIPVAAFNPLTYAVNAVRDIMLKGSLPFGAFMIDSTILIVFAAVMLALSFFLFKDINE